MSTNTTAINNNNSIIENVVSIKYENNINNNQNNNVDNKTNNIYANNDINKAKDNKVVELCNKENICLIIKGLLNKLFHNKFIIYGNYELPNNLKYNKYPLVQLPPEDAYKILYSFMDITFNNSIFIFLTLLFISNKTNKINRKEFISFIKSDKRTDYCLALIISVIKSCSIVAVFILSIFYIYPKYSCTKSLFKDKDDNLFWINNGKKYKVNKIYNTVYFLRIIYFILYDCVFIIYNLIFIVCFKKIGAHKILIILYQIIEYILLISIYILTYTEEDICIRLKNKEFTVQKNEAKKLDKIIIYILIDLIKYILK